MFRIGFRVKIGMAYVLLLVRGRAIFDRVRRRFKQDALPFQAPADHGLSVI
jgi:hypothetical protein